jgi:ribosomal protein S7
MKNKQNFLISRANSFFSTGSNFLIKAGKKAKAAKLLQHAIWQFLFYKPKDYAHHVKIGTQLIKLNWNRLRTGLRAAQPKVKFLSQFIKKRVRKVPTAARGVFQKRLVWSLIAGIIRRTRQNSKYKLFSELELIARQSQYSRIFKLRDNIHKKADLAKSWVRRARLPFYPMSKIALLAPYPNKKILDKKIWENSVIRVRARRKRLLKVYRIATYYSNKKLLRPLKNFKSKFSNLKYNLFFSQFWRERFKKYTNVIYKHET